MERERKREKGGQKAQGEEGTVMTSSMTMTRYASVSSVFFIMGQKNTYFWM